MPELDRAAYVTLDSTYNGLKSIMEEVEGAKEDNINKYNSALDAGECVRALGMRALAVRTESGRNCTGCMAETASVRRCEVGFGNA